VTVRIKAPDGRIADVALERASGAGAGTYRVSIRPEGAETETPRGLEVEIEHRFANAGRLRIGGKVRPFRAHRDGKIVWVWIDGRTHSLEIVPRTAQRAAGAGAGGVEADLTAPMPGKILEVKAAVGGVYEAHAPLIVMESMKMEMTLSAPGPVRIREIMCAEGKLVEMGELLARLEPAPRDAASHATDAGR